MCSPRADTRVGPCLALIVSLILCAEVVSAQTRIRAPANKYTPAQDVQLGRKAEAEVRQRLPMLSDAQITAYVASVGRRLLAGVPSSMRHREFRYTFHVVNARDINAFALPGGPMYVNRGMLEAATTEGQVAGVMAHELSHIVLRHGTAQASKATKYEVGTLAGAILGAIIGGRTGNVVAQGTRISLGTAFMRFSREFERQADIEGAQIMARAGYDPRQMANMFRTIEAEGGRNGPEFLSSHPNPGNRFQAINREASMLQVNGNASNQSEFDAVKGRLTTMSPAYTAEQIARGQARTGNAPSNTGARAAVNVEPPSGQFRSYTPAEFLRVSVPANWGQNPATDGVTYAPSGGLTQDANGRTGFTHGVQIGVMQGNTGNLQRDTDQLLQGFMRANPDLKRASNYARATVGNRQGLTTNLTNVSAATGQREFINVTTAPLRDGRVLFLIGVSPETDANAYAGAFNRVRQLLQINDR